MGHHRTRLSRSSRAAALALVAALCACGSPKPPPGPEHLAETYLAAKRYPEALRESEKLVRLQPRNVQYRLLAARANEGAGDTQRALSHLEMAQEIAPSDAEATILIGELEQRLQNPDDAYVAFRRATMLAPENQRAWRGLALTAEALGFEGEAERAYARWAELEKVQGEKQ
jgi:tetratricopeptide (TPR) repeat protein